MHRPLLALALLSLAAAPAPAAGGSRLAYLDGNDPYYPSRTFPKLTTPQWVGEEGVEAVVILAIDDMRGHQKWETFLRPILNRLKRIDGRAPVSIMTCQIDPKEPHLQKWLKEGVSLEVHTIDHPCPILRDGDFKKAKSTYDRCVDLLASVPNSRPVAFRTPCCDSLNTVSPRLFAEIINQTTPRGNFLQVDSSVFNLITANDPDLPRELVLEGGRERFRKYLPADRTFVNYIEDYPYPYVIGGKCWEFPCVVPSDWSAQHYHKPNNPVTVRDWKAALDATVLKQGVFNLVFHPHGWIKAEQIIDLIDHAVTKHGKKVKFLTFREALERLNKNLLGGVPLRDPKTGEDNGVRLADFDVDGYMDVFITNKATRERRTWVPKKGGSGSWKTEDVSRAAKWNEVAPFKGFMVSREVTVDRRRPVRVAANEKEQAVFIWFPEKGYVRAKFTLPAGVRLGLPGEDSGLRFVDIDEDGREDIVFSNEKEYGIYLFTDLDHGWGKKVMAGKAGDRGALPPIAVNGKNAGFFVHSRALWWQNENTNLLKDLVDRRSFNDLLRDVEPGPKSPEASLKCLRPRPGFVAELAAAEPLVQDPIAFAWGPDGKLWVVEMGDYPLGTDGKGRPGGRVKFLESTRGDGKYDRATVFLDNLPFPTGVLPWRKGVLVTCAPDIFYAEDADGDGKADKRVTLYTGFVEGNQQHRVNTLAYGLDNWIYVANGDSGGQVKSVKTGKVIDLRGRDLRIRPDTGDLDAQSGQTQYGRCRDDWGNWFGGNNSNPVWHYALADHYTRRNPHAAAPDPRVMVSVTPGAAPVFPISRTLPRFNDPHAANHFTSACSPVIYRDDLFGPEFAGNAFVSEPVHNLVHREVMAAKGVTFTSRRAADEQQSEFLASSDNWFRPTMIRVGPDGALWVADMYRHVIEHPQWIPAEWQKKLDLRAGHDKGRIYRVYPVGSKPRPIPRLDRLDTAGLVAALDSPSGWQRDLAQMMLVWRADKSAVPLLEKMAAENKHPLARLHALCTLDGLGALKPEVLRKALADPHPGVRRHAVRLGEPASRRLDSGGLLPELVKLAADPDAQVRLQLACTLGEWDDPRAGKALGRLAAESGGDRYLLAAVMSSVNARNLDAVLPAVLASGRGAPPQVIAGLLRQAEALGNKKALTTAFAAVATADRGRHAAWQFAALAAVLDALDERGVALAQLARDRDADLAAAVGRLEALFAAARKRVADRQLPPGERAAAARLLGRGLKRQAEDQKLLAELLVPQTPEEVQSAAVATLGRLRGPSVPPALLRGWKAYSPALRGQVLDVLILKWPLPALDAIASKQVPATEIDAARRQRFLQHPSAAVRERAARVFAGAVNPDRQKVVESFRPALSLKGDPARGAQLFARHCAACHKFGGVGHEVGPDLASLGDKSPEALLVAVLDPNRAVESRYVNYQAATKAGLVHSGILASETGNSVTLLGQDGKRQTILRADLEALESTGKSPMPEGLEKELKPQDLADLIAHLRAGLPPERPKSFDGNHPEVVKPAGDGSLFLKATTCEIYGRTLVFEAKYRNLGFWGSADDRAEWSAELPRAGKYAVWLRYACADATAGNAFLLTAGDRQLTGKVRGTGTWDDYREVRIGEIELSAGRQRVVFRSAGMLKGHLMDLVAIRLVPVK